MIEKELIESFSKLDINEKRNQISGELERLALLLDTVHKECNIEKMPSSIYNYNKAKDKDMSDEKYFDLMYENIVFLRKDILTLANILIRNQKIK